MHTPLKPVLKSTLVFLSLTSLWACNYDLGERTLDMEDATTVLVERNMKATDSGTETPASCIALPSTWPEPTSVEITGTAQVEGATQAFTVIPARYTDGETAINAHLEMNDYSWYCYIDQAREFAYTEDAETFDVIYADSGKIQYTLTPNSDQDQVFTTLGFEDGGDENRPSDYYYNQMASHHVIKNHMVDSHFTKLGATFSQENFDTSYDNYDIFQHNGFSYFVGNSTALVSQMDGSYEVREIPSHSQIYLLNNLFVAYQSNSTANTVSISYSTDMSSWSEAKDASILGYHVSTFSYDTKNALYVALNMGSSEGEVKGYYTSSDLESWTHSLVGSYQNHRVLFSEDGRALMRNSSGAASLMSRTKDGEWIVFEQFPVSDNSFLTRDIIFANDRFHALIKEYDFDTSNYINIYVGYSDDLTTWNWTAISNLEDDFTKLNDLTALANNQIAISGGERLYLSNNNGVTWNAGATPASALNMADTVDTNNHTYYVTALVNHNGTTYGTASVNGSNNFSAQYHFTSTDFVNFESAVVSNGAQFLSVNDSLYLMDATYARNWDLYQYVTPAMADALKLAEDLNNELTQSQLDLLAANEALSISKAELLVANEALATAQADVLNSANALTAAQADSATTNEALEAANANALASAEALAIIEANAASATQALTEALAQVSSSNEALAAAEAEALSAQQALSAAEERALNAEENAATQSSSGSSSSGIGSMNLFLLMLIALGMVFRRQQIAT